MNLILCTDVFRDNGQPSFQVMVYDIDYPVNFHSYNCLFFKQGRNLEVLLEEANRIINNNKP